MSLTTQENTTATFVFHSKERVAELKLLDHDQLYIVPLQSTAFHEEKDYELITALADGGLTISDFKVPELSYFYLMTPRYRYRAHIN